MSIPNPLDDVSNTAENVDGVAEEQSYALPLTEGELYPLELIPTPSLQRYNSVLQVYEEIPTKPSSTLKSVLSEERNPYEYLGC